MQQAVRGILVPDWPAPPGVRAAAIHSGLDGKTSWRNERELEEGRLDIVYVAPERVLSSRA